MANPSLQIGNDNWAIKEDNLLGYSTAGTRFVPQPITMTRATLGTRVNPSGLVEDVALLGSELVSCGDFACADPDAVWSRGTGWTISGNLANFTYSTPSSLTQDLNVTSGLRYLIEYEIVSNSGVSLKGGGNSFFNVGSSIPSTVGLHSFYVTAVNSSGIDFRYLSGSGSLSVTNVSVKEATIDGLARVDYTDGTSSLLVEPERRNLITYSEDFSQWLTSGSPTVTYNATTSPNGTTNATELLSTSGASRFQISLGILSAGDHTQSVFVKYKDADVRMNFMNNAFGGSNTFNITSSGVTLNTSSNPTNIEDIGNGWYKISVTYTANGTNGSYLQIFGDLDTTYASYYLWGGSLEAGAYPTSYIPNFGTVLGVTRNQDIFTRDGIGSLIGQTEGTFFIELSKPVLETDYHYLISLNNAASNSHNNSVAIGFDGASDDFYIRLRASGVSVFLDSSRASLANTFYKIAIAYKSGASLIYIDGSPITPNSGSLASAFTFAVTLDNLSFDYNGNNVLPFYGKVRQLQVYKTALTGSELATLTTI